ncbi:MULTISPECIES: methyl-accepting chemotaxis protein [Agrobacterium tumefaciens complex]|jgi:methyl-accepting chemotaxis protein|uniref:Methyl-accepting chemotaxis protein n=1 Tax=Agrobacterium radiobacter TaxID=362 RepID=A0ABD5LIJ4_AGRRD|nr:MULTISPECIES: methyl-accepting chemotaxis protein [Agrobacterium tumefaciens complex]MCP2133805.1 methyl-accepting chemotaxis protein [Rhizobium sp. SLBN-94]TGE80837.1 methyl-accepting chemotaxis protein [Rhizobium sp. SEMIA 439]EPR22757.1 chemotaxis protein [Agrobacterium radiobacter DSM 30147]KAA1237731.1 HAMP domain-containing protein [Agrobacterium tumefaciens]KAB0460359.1 HAMP domain-containing protein [Agrobacterium tumefaciens]
MRNIPVVGKFLTVFALFGICAILIAAYSAVQIKTIDKSYSDLIEHDSAAALNLALANHALLNGRAALADMMIAFTEEGNAAAEVEAKATRGEFAQLMDKAIASVPRDSRLPALKDEALRLYNITCKNAWNLGRTASNVEEALASQKAFGMECQPVFARIGAKLTQIATEITTRNDTESGALTETSDQTALITVVAVILGFLTVVVAGYFAIRTWLVTPMQGLAGTMQRLANGDLSANIDGTDRRDEVGTMAKAVQIFKDNELKARRLEADAAQMRDQSEADRQRAADIDRRRAAEMAEATSGLAGGLKHMADGDLSYQLTTPFAADFESLRADFNMAVGQLNKTLLSVAEVTATIDGGSQELNSSAGDLSHRTETQAASLEETAAALDQITSNVSNSTKRTEEARSVAVEANRSAQTSGQVVANAVDAMKRIESSSSQISNIIGVIDEIAFQTNLLALNAGVEAARAGEAGKGFAVVAQEVRELAQRSAQAAKEIKELIRNSADEVQNGVKLVTATGDALKVIEGHVIAINTQLDAIATSAREQSVGLAEVNSAVNQMDQVTQQNAAMVERAKASSTSLAGDAETLREIIGQFRLDGTAATACKTRNAHQPSTQLRVADNAQPRPSPARRMMGQVAAALGVSTASKEQSWAEF